MIKICSIQFRYLFRTFQQFGTKSNLPIQNALLYHEDILSNKEIYSTIASIAPTLDKQFLHKLNQDIIDLDIWRQLKRRQNLSLLPIQQCINILKKVHQLQDKKSQSVQTTKEGDITQLQVDVGQTQIMNKIYDRFIIHFQSKLSELSLSQIAEILKLYAKANRFNQVFFREIENEIYERISDSQTLTYQDAEKILWSYQFCRYGSAILYGKLAQVFKIAQFEINPLKLSYYAHLYSKCQENIKGGFGLYKVAEEQVTSRIQDYDFHELVKFAKYFYSVNIGSNDFQIMLEEKLSINFPKNENIKISDLVRLTKATSKYLFRYNSFSLWNKMEAANIYLLPFLSNKQFCLIVWSFLRSQKGSHQFYDVAEEEMKKRLLLIFFNQQEQLALIFINTSNFPDSDDIQSMVLEELKQRITKIPIGSTLDMARQIELTLVLTGLLLSQKEQPLQKLLINLHRNKIIQISTGNRRIDLLNSILQSTLTEDSIQLMQLLCSYQSNDQLAAEDLIIEYSKRFCNRYFDADYKKKEWSERFELKKQYFYLVFNLNPLNIKYLQMLTFLCDQHEMDMRYVFKQDHWVVISWDILANLLIDKQQTDPRLIQQAILGIKQVDPNLLNSLSLIKYTQALALVAYLEKIPIGQLDYKFSRLIKNKKKSIIHNNVHIQNVDLMTDTFQLELRDILCDVVSQQIPKHIEIDVNKYINMFEEESFQFIPIALLIQINKQLFKFALIPLSLKYDFEEEYSLSNISEDLFYRGALKINRRFLVLKFILENVYSWNVEFIIKEKWDEMPLNSKQELINKLFSVDITSEDVLLPDLPNPKQIIKEEKPKKRNKKLNLLKSTFDKLKSQRQFATLYDGEQTQSEEDDQ